MKKVFSWKTIDKNNNYVEVRITGRKFAQAEKSLIKTCMQAHLTPLEYLGWEEQAF